MAFFRRVLIQKWEYKLLFRNLRGKLVKKIRQPKMCLFFKRTGDAVKENTTELSMQ